MLYNSYTNQILSYHNRRPFKVFEMICGTDDDDLDDLMYMRDLAQAHDDDDAESLHFIPFKKPS